MHALCFHHNRAPVTLHLQHMLMVQDKPFFDLSLNDVAFGGFLFAKPLALGKSSSSSSMAGLDKGAGLDLRTVLAPPCIKEEYEV